MSINRNLAAPRNEFDQGKVLATRTGKVIHRLVKVHEDQELAETSCTKFLPAIVPTKVTIVERKGRWGVLLGTGTLPTCKGCLAAHFAERAADPREVALANIDALPANEQGHTVLQALYGTGDASAAKVGDQVYGYSRGMYRRGVVTKVTPTKVHMVYTTDGAVREAKRIHEHIAGTNPTKIAENMANQAARNYAYYAKTAAEYQRRVDGGEAHEALSGWEVKDFANITELLKESREDYIARCAMEAFDSSHEKLQNNTSYTKYVNYTTKAVDKNDAYLVS